MSGKHKCKFVEWPEGCKDAAGADDYIEPTDYIEDEVLLTMDQVKQWEARLAEIRQELERLRAEEKVLSRKLAAARVLGFLNG